MARDVQAILKLQVPVIVRLGYRYMTLDNVLALAPGAIIELPKNAQDALDLMVNNKLIGHGVAVKLGENFGLKVTAIGAPSQRVQALGAAQSDPASSPRPADDDAASPSEQALQGQS